MPNTSVLDMKGSVTVIARNAETGLIEQQTTVPNTIVRNGRVALSKLIAGVAAEGKSYVVLDATFPRTYEPSPDMASGWMGLTVEGESHLYSVGPIYTANPAYNATVGPVTRDATGFATYLNKLFTAYPSGAAQRTPVYNANGDVVNTIPYTVPLSATVVTIDGVQRVKISKTQNGMGAVAPYSTYAGATGDFWTLFYTDDSLFGINTVVYEGTEVSVSASDYVVSSMQLGTSNSPVSITNSGFNNNDYVSLKYPTSVSFGQSDSALAYDTKAIYEITIPSTEGNGPAGTGTTYTEAALLCRNDQWFSHVSFGQFFKTENISLTVRWTIDFMP